MTFCGGSKDVPALDATLLDATLLDATLLDATEEATDDAVDEATEEAAADDATADEATEDAATEDALLDAAEVAVLDDVLAAFGLYEHQVEVVGAPGKFESWHTKLPVNVAYPNTPALPMAA